MSSMELTIRPAEESDIEALRVLMTELAGHPISAGDVRDRLDLVEASDIDWLYVCEDAAGEVIGMMSFRIRHNIEEATSYGEVSTLVVRSDIRKSGIGQRLIDYADGLAREKGCIGLWLVSGFGPEEAAHSFYKRLGFTINGYRFIRPF